LGLELQNLGLGSERQTLKSYPNGYIQTEGLTTILTAGLESPDAKWSYPTVNSTVRSALV